MARWLPCASQVWGGPRGPEPEGWQGHTHQPWAGDRSWESAQAMGHAHSGRRPLTGQGWADQGPEDRLPHGGQDHPGAPQPSSHMLPFPQLDPVPPLSTPSRPTSAPELLAVWRMTHILGHEAPRALATSVQVPRTWACPASCLAVEAAMPSTRAGLWRPGPPPHPTRPQQP